MRYLSELLSAQIQTEIKHVELKKGLARNQLFDKNLPFGLLDTLGNGFLTVKQVNVADIYILDKADTNEDKEISM